MATTLRWGVLVVIAGHGLIHLVGAAKGFGLADVSQLTRPIGFLGGILWLLAAGLVLTAAVAMGIGAPTWWWALAAAAAVVSQVAVVTSWHDARFGTLVNIVLVLAAGYSFASEGPTSSHADYRNRAASALADVGPSPSLLTKADLVDLPEPVAAYVRHSGALGRSRVVSLRAHFHGRIRSGPDAAWMPFTGQQVNTYGRRPQRLFLMDATRSGLPVTVLHVFAHTTATMRVKLLSLFTVVDASGPEMDRGETVTVFNDLVLMAPGAIAHAPVSWTAIDDLHVRGDFTDGDQTVSAVLTFDAEHDLVDFASEDRSRASANGKAFTREPWSTPVTGHHVVDGRRVFTLGEGVWNAAGPGESFTYLDFQLDDVRYNERTPPGEAQATPDLPGTFDSVPLGGSDPRWRSRPPTDPRR